MEKDYLKELIERADKIATECKEQLNKEGCPSLADFFDWDEDAGKNGEWKRNSDKIKKLHHSVFNDKKPINRKENNVWSGLYAFGRMTDEGDVVPVYIGRSRDILNRFKQHGFGGSHNQSSLAYLIAQGRLTDEDHIVIREIIESSESSSKRAALPIENLEAAMEEVKGFKVYLFPEARDYEQYFLEVAVAGLLDAEHNKWRTS
jgi:hypothetical protein